MLRFPQTLIVLLAMLFVIASEPPAQAQNTEKIKIGFSVEAMKGERWQTDLDSFQARAEQLGAEVISSNACGNDDVQLQQVKDMIKAGIQVLVLLPHDTNKASRIVGAAESAHVKVVSYDRLVQEEAALAAEQAFHLAKGEKTAADGTISNGKINVPTVMLKPVLVTKDNIESTV